MCIKSDLNNYYFRLASMEDINKLIEMRLELQKHIEKSNSHLWVMSEKMIAELKDEFRKQVDDDNIIITLVVEKGIDEIIGMGIGRVIYHDYFVPEVFGRIDDVWINEGHRRKGLCKKLLKELIAFFESKGVESLTLDYVVGNNVSKSMWLNIGFKPVLTIANARLSDIIQQL